MQRRQAARWAAIGVLVLLTALLVVVLMFTQTDWGRERVRSVALDRLGSMINGEVEIGRVEGNLLRRVRLIDVTIRDRQGRPFLEADTLETRFGLRALLQQRLALADVRVVGAHVILDKPPGEEWNYVRIFDTDGDDRQPDAPGWGDWVALDDVTLVDTRVTVRDEWQPPDDLTPEEANEAIRRALAGDAREHVVKVPGGYQNVMEFRELNAQLPRVLAAHPDSAGITFRVSTLSGFVRPFSPPPARVHDFAGDFRLVRDSLFMSGVRAELDDSRLTGGGVYALHSGDLLLIANANPVAFADLRWIHPALPEEGGGTMMMTIEVRSLVNRILLQDMDVAIGDARVEGRLDVTTGDTLRFGPTDLRFARLETGFVERLVDVEFPRSGEMTGTLAIRGPPRSLTMDADVRFDDAAGPTSRILAEGGLAVEPDLRFRELRLSFQPLHAQLARAVVADLPLNGTIEGSAVVTGTPEDLDLTANLELRDPRHGLSRVRLAGGLDTRGEARLRNMVVRMDPLRLDLLRDEIPALPAGASATGRMVLDGVLARAVTVDGDIVLNDPATGVSEIGATGRLAFADGLRFDDLRLRFSPLQAELARTFVPELALQGTIAGTATVTGSPESLDLVADLELRDPRYGLSRVVANGGIDTRGELRLRDMALRMDPLRLDMLREEVPELPAGAAATGRVVLDGSPSGALRVDGDIRLDDPATGTSQIAATGVLRLGDPLSFDALRVRMDPLRADLLRPWLPDLPPGGSLVGALSLDGTPSGFIHVDGQVAHHHPELGVSRVEMRGGVDLAGPLEFRDLDLRLEPLNMALARAIVPDLPLGGTLTGTARLNGSTDARIAVRGDLVHVEGGERSHVVGQADVAMGSGGWASVDVRLQPLSLDVAGRFFPGAGLHGSVSGRLLASGDMSDVTVDADLTAADGGRIRADGTLNLAGATPIYDLDMRLQDFDLAAVSWRAPAETDLTGTVSARGSGTDPATMNAVIAADLVASDVGDVGADLVRLRLAMEGGLARVDSSRIRLGDAEALLDGTFGLVAGRDGVLAYEIEVDSLHAFAAWLPGADSGVAAIRRPVQEPAQPAVDDVPAPEVEIAAETADAARAAELAATAGEPVRRYRAADGAVVTETLTLVEASIEREDREPQRARVQAVAEAVDDAADGVAADTTLAGLVAADTAADPLEVPSDSLAGSLYASGTARGNVTAFDLDGRAVVNDLFYQAAYVGAGEVEFDLADVRTASPGIRLDADLHEVRYGGVAFDSLSAEGRYRGLRGDGTGEAVIVAHGTDDTEYRADAAFELSPAASELRIADLTLRHDTVTWQMARPGVLSWANDAISVASIDFRSDAGGRVRLDGRLPVDGSGDLDVVIEELDISQFAALLQLDRDAAGRLNVDANVQGTLEAPRVDGTVELAEARLDGRSIPDVLGSFAYAAQEMTVDVAMYHDGRTLATAVGSLPMDLSLRPNFAPRLLPGELSLDVQADSLPIEAIPAFSQQVTDARGRVRGDLSIRGTYSDPVVTGDVDLAFGSVTLAPLGLILEEVGGRLTLEGDRILLDSLVARSEGQLQISGEIGMASLTNPSFELDIESREMLVIDTEDAKLRVDADLTVAGTLAAIEVTGDVRTRSGVIYIPRLTEMGETRVVSLHSPVGSERIDTEFYESLRLPGQPPIFERLRLDVSVQIDRDVWLRSTEANVEIYTPRDVGPLHILVEGSGSGLALEGTINTDRGEYEFMSRRFDLTRGAATFTADPKINPVLQIAAEHEVRLPGREAFDVRVLIGGTLRDLEIALESNSQPPISQTDLLAYLAFGRNASSLLYRQGSPLSSQAGDAGEIAGNVAGLATQQLGTVALDAVLNDIEAELMRDLHVDVFRITPADLPPDMFTGRYTDLLRSTEVEAGRYLSSRFFVAGQINTGVSRPGVRVEYAAPFGLQWETTWRSQWMTSVPTLMESDPTRAGVLGSFLLREWRY